MTHRAMSSLKKWLSAVSLAGVPAACDGGDHSWDDQRAAMVRDQIAARGIRDVRVLEAMRQVPRHEFVPLAMRSAAYDDTPLPIGHGQTVSQPFIVALMTEALAPEPHHRVLEIGTGSGYQAAVLARIVAEVFTIEIVGPLATGAAETLERLGIRNVHVRDGDGWQGLPDKAPFDAIIVTCAPEAIPAPLAAQLREGGRMVIPVGPEGGVQELVLAKKKDGKIHTESILPVRFVPMTGEGQ